jgi:hypothetical protein
VREAAHSDCGKNQHEKFAEGSHFDTNHHLTVLWDANTVDVAMEKLKATIRATIPEATREWPRRH